MLGFQTAMIAPAWVSQYIQHTFRARSPPVEFYVSAWAQTSHALAEHMRMGTEAKLMTLVFKGGPLGDALDVVRARRGGPSGVLTMSDAFPQLLGELEAAKKLASPVQPERDYARHTQAPLRRRLGQRRQIRQG